LLPLFKHSILIFHLIALWGEPCSAQVSWILLAWRTLDKQVHWIAKGVSKSHWSSSVLGGCCNCSNTDCFQCRLKQPVIPVNLMMMIALFSIQHTVHMKRVEQEVPGTMKFSTGIIQE